MHKNRQLVVFARAPRLGYGKTRLAREIGAAAAHNFYQTCLSQLLLNCSNGPWELVVAVASANDCDHSLFDAHQVITQTQGDIGQRMLHVLSQNNQQHTLIIGSDIPELNPDHLERAFNALESYDLVFGPATDGGFWSVGCRKNLTLPEEFMRNVRWSSQYALTDTLLSIPEHLTVAQIDTLTDVDDAVSYYQQQ